MRVILWHLLNRDVGVIAVSHTPQGAAILEDVLPAAATKSNRNQCYER